MIRIHLQEQALEPGSELEGRVEWVAERESIESVSISLLWYTEGKGTEDVEVVQHRQVSRPSMQGDHDFSFRLPDFPWSFSGTLISLVWAVEASLEPDGAVERVTLVSAPEAREVEI